MSPILLPEKMITEQTITELVEQYLVGSDIFLVDVAVKAGNAIRVHVDRMEGISIDECVKISRYLNEKLDRDAEDYSLEVSSPGLGAPFRVKQQYDKNCGRHIEVRLKEGSTVTGKLQTVSDHGIVVEEKGKEREIEFETIKTTKTIISFN